MSERIKVGARGQVVIPKKVRKKLNIEHGMILEVEETKNGILLKPYNPVRKLRGLGKGLFGDPVKYQRKLREEWEK
jgi:AbrB family looped-hinge helix DNA binding protein